MIFSFFKLYIHILIWNEPSSLVKNEKKLFSHLSLFSLFYMHNSFKLTEYGPRGVNGLTANLSSVVLEIERAPGHVTLLRRQVEVKTVRGSLRGARDVIL